METPSPKADELLEKPFLTFVIYHTKSLTEALEYLTFKTLATLQTRRVKYGIPDPPTGYYTGPKLTQGEMVFNFLASSTTEPWGLTPEIIRQVMHAVIVSIGMTGGPIKTYLLSQLLSLPSTGLPPSGGARLAQCSRTVES